MALTIFSLQDSPEKVGFFEKTFIMVNVNIEMGLSLPFFFFSNINIEFLKLRKLAWRFCDIIKVLFIISWIEFINKR